MKRGGRKNFGYFSWAKPIFGKEPRPPIEELRRPGSGPAWIHPIPLRPHCPGQNGRGNRLLRSLAARPTPSGLV